MNTKRVSNEKKYHFDTLGFLLIKNVLDEYKIEKMKKTFIKVKNNNDYNSIHLNKKEMIPDDVNHASRVFIDDHYVRLNHLDKLDDNFSFLINHQIINHYIECYVDKPKFDFSWGISNSPGDYFSSWHSRHKPSEYRFKKNKIHSPSVNAAFFISNNLKDDGSLLVVPGSHKSDYKLEFRKYISHELTGSMPVEGNAGDILLFSECFIHCEIKKFTKGESINLYYLYSRKNLIKWVSLLRMIYLVLVQGYK